MKQAVCIKTAEGVFKAHFSDEGLTGLEFPKGKSVKAANRFTASAEPALKRKAASVEKALANGLAARRVTPMPTLDISAGTDFQQLVWRALLSIPSGETRTYAQVAEMVGRPKAARAVGAACGANPIPVLIPCHRVVASNGRLGGYSGGLDWKIKLLRREGALAA